MAAHITHAALAERVYDKHFYKLNRRDFLIGALFPDIRYLGHVKREITHFEKINFDHILAEKNSFLAGMLYHSFVDKIREEWMVGNGLYDLIPYEHRWMQAVKLFEDRFFYSDIPNWQIVEAYFKNILPDELKFGMSKDVIEQWHSVLVKYFMYQPTAASILTSTKEMGLSEQIAHDINLHIEVIEKNKNLIKLAQKFHDEYESILSKAI
jgi:hypothetical protein